MITVQKSPSSTLFFDPNALDSLYSEMFTKEYWEHKNAVLGSSTGRGVALFVQGPQGPLVLRHYYRGGLAAHMLQDRFLMCGLKRCRSWREFALLQTLFHRGLPVPQPIAGRSVPQGLYYRCDLLTGFIPHTHTLVARLHHKPVPLETWQRIGGTLRLFHDNSVYHADLNAHNILLDHKDNVWLIDFDRGALCSYNLWKQAMLRRLLRSLRKEHRKGVPFFWQEAHWHSLMTGYEQGLPQSG